MHRQDFVKIVDTLPVLRVVSRFDFYDRVETLST